MRNFLLGSITFFVGLLVALFAAELVTRIFWVPPSTLSTQQTEKHPVYGWAPRPGISGRQVSMEFDYSFIHTAQGLRGDTIFSASRPHDKQNRILFLGDSFTYGIGSENGETFVERINAHFPQSEVINTGANAYGQRQELALLDTLGAALKPDVIVLMFFWNDPEDNLGVPTPNFMISDDDSVIRTDMKVPASFNPLALRKDLQIAEPRQRLLRRTYLYKLFKEGARGFRHRLFGGKERTIQTVEKKEAAWKITRELLRAIKLRSREIGSSLIVVSIPDYQLVAPQTGLLKGQKTLNIEIESELREACDEIGIEYLDMLPELARVQAASTAPLYYLTDRHLTPLGNAAVAKILAPAIASLLDR